MQIAQRLNKIHPDKLLGTLQSHIDDGHEQAALQAIPDLQLGFPQFQNELEQIRGKLTAKLRDDIKVINPQSASVFNCANCCLLYTSPSPRDRQKSRMPSSA